MLEAHAEASVTLDESLGQVTARRNPMLIRFERTIHTFETIWKSEIHRLPHGRDSSILLIRRRNDERTCFWQKRLPALAVAGSLVLARFGSAPQLGARSYHA